MEPVTGVCGYYFVEGTSRFNVKWSLRSHSTAVSLLNFRGGRFAGVLSTDRVKMRAGLKL